MPDYEEKYRKLNNLQIRKLMADVDRLEPLAAEALRGEADARGLAAVPKRIRPEKPAVRAGPLKQWWERFEFKPGGPPTHE